MSRQKGQTGSNYSGLNLASFRGSSELEYGADSAYLFVPGEGFDPERGGPVTLECGKNRYGTPTDLITHFDPSVQTFGPAPTLLSGLGGFDAVTPAAPLPQRKGRSCAG